jgi:hypothetical protein
MSFPNFPFEEIAEAITSFGYPGDLTPADIAKPKYCWQDDAHPRVVSALLLLHHSGGSSQRGHGPIESYTSSSEFQCSLVYPLSNESITF